MNETLIQIKNLKKTYNEEQSFLTPKKEAQLDKINRQITHGFEGIFNFRRRDDKELRMDALAKAKELLHAEYVSSHLVQQNK